MTEQVTPWATAWVVPCWRHDLACQSTDHMVDVSPTERIPATTCKECMEFRAGCLHAIPESERHPVQLWPPEQDTVELQLRHESLKTLGRELYRILGIKGDIPDWELIQKGIEKQQARIKELEDRIEYWEKWDLERTRGNP